MTSFIFPFSPRGKRSRTSGFTLIEMIVSVALMLVISTIIAMNQSKYTSGAELRNLANDLSLSLRQAQVYGISVKEFTTGTSNFNAGYGVEFDLTSRGDNDSYIFFADRGSRDQIYNDGWHCPIGGDSECLDKISLGQNNFISDLCYINSSGSKICGVTRLDISFVRPAVEARIIINGDTAGSSGVKGSCIKLSSVDGKSHTISVYVTGQISIDSPVCS